MWKKLVPVVMSGALLLLASCGTDSASDGDETDWSPTKSVTILINAAPGGATDQAAREIARLLGQLKLVDKPVSVENVTGSGGLDAWIRLNRAKGDPNVLGVVATSYLTGPAQGDLPFDFKSFTTLGIVDEQPFVVSTGPDSPFNSLSDLKDPSKPITYGGTQVGALDSFIANGLEAEIPTKLNYVTYGGAAKVVVDVMGGKIQLGGGPAGVLAEYAKADRVKVLAVLAEERSPALPDVPTAVEQGFAELVFNQFQGVVAAADLKPSEREFWIDAMRTVAESQEWADFAEKTSVTPRSIMGDDAHKYLEDAYARMLPVLKDLGLVKGK